MSSRPQIQVPDGIGWWYYEDEGTSAEVLEPEGTSRDTDDDDAPEWLQDAAARAAGVKDANALAETWSPAKARRVHDSLAAAVEQVEAAAAAKRAAAEAQALAELEVKEAAMARAQAAAANEAREASDMRAAQAEKMAMQAAAALELTEQKLKATQAAATTLREEAAQAFEVRDEAVLYLRDRVRDRVRDRAWCDEARRAMAAAEAAARDAETQAQRAAREKAEAVEAAQARVKAAQQQAAMAQEERDMAALVMALQLHEAEPDAERLAKVREASKQASVFAQQAGQTVTMREQTARERAQAPQAQQAEHAVQAAQAVQAQQAVRVAQAAAGRDPAVAAARHAQAAATEQVSAGASASSRARRAAEEKEEAIRRTEQQQVTRTEHQQEGPSFFHGWWPAPPLKIEDLGDTAATPPRMSPTSATTSVGSPSGLSGSATGIHVETPISPISPVLPFSAVWPRRETGEMGEIAVFGSTAARRQLLPGLRPSSAYSSGGSLERLRPSVAHFHGGSAQPPATSPPVDLKIKLRPTTVQEPTPAPATTPPLDLKAKLRPAASIETRPLADFSLEPTFDGICRLEPTFDMAAPAAAPPHSMPPAPLLLPMPTKAPSQPLVQLSSTASSVDTSIHRWFSSRDTSAVEAVEAPAKAEVAKAEAARAEAVNTETAKAEAAKAEVAKTEAAKEEVAAVIKEGRAEAATKKERVAALAAAAEAETKLKRAEVSAKAAAALEAAMKAEAEAAQAAAAATKAVAAEAAEAAASKGTAAKAAAAEAAASKGTAAKAAAASEAAPAVARAAAADAAVARAAAAAAEAPPTSTEAPNPVLGFLDSLFNSTRTLTKSEVDASYWPPPKHVPKKTPENAVSQGTAAKAAAAEAAEARAAAAKVAAANVTAAQGAAAEAAAAKAASAKAEAARAAAAIVAAARAQRAAREKLEAEAAAARAVVASMASEAQSAASDEQVLDRACLLLYGTPAEAVALEAAAAEAEASDDIDAAWRMTAAEGAALRRAQRLLEAVRLEPVMTPVMYSTPPRRAGDDAEPANPVEKEAALVGGIEMARWRLENGIIEAKSAESSGTQASLQIKQMSNELSLFMEHFEGLSVMQLTPLSKSEREAAKLTLSPTKQAEQWYGAGIDANNGGDTERALAYFMQALSVEPERPNFLLSAGNMHLKLGQPAEALRLYKHCEKWLTTLPAPQAAMLDEKTNLAHNALLAARRGAEQRETRRQLNKIHRENPIRMLSPPPGSDTLPNRGLHSNVEVREKARDLNSTLSQLIPAYSPEDYESTASPFGESRPSRAPSRLQMKNSPDELQLRTMTNHASRGALDETHTEREELRSCSPTLLLPVPRLTFGEQQLPSLGTLYPPMSYSHCIPPPPPPRRRSLSRNPSTSALATAHTQFDVADARAEPREFLTVLASSLQPHHLLLLLLLLLLLMLSLLPDWGVGMLDARLGASVAPPARPPLPKWVPSHDVTEAVALARAATRKAHGEITRNLGVRWGPF